MTEIATTPGPTQIVPYSDLNAQLVAIEAENARTRFDYETPAGEKAARSHIHKLRLVRGKLEAERKRLKADALAWGRTVDSGAQELDARIAGMIAVHQEPLDATAKREEERVARIDAAVQAIRQPRAALTLPVGLALATAALATVEAIAIDPDVYQERMAEAVKLKAAEAELIRIALDEAVARESAAAEAKRVRLEAEAKERAERERRIAEAAAAKAKADAEAEAAREREAAAAKVERDRREAEDKARREREAIEAAAKKEREEAARKIRESEEKAAAERAAAERRERDLAERIAREKAEAEQREARAKAEAETAARRAREDADRRVREVEEAAARKAEGEVAEQAKREGNRRHVAGINRAAAAAIRAIVDAGGDEIAENIVRAIVAGKIPAVTIRY